MRIGLLGPTDGDAEVFRDAVEFLIGDVAVDYAIYLGPEDDTLDTLLTDWASEVFEGSPTVDDFLERAHALAAEGEPDAIDALLKKDAFVRQLRKVRKLPPAPTRAVEMVSDRFVIAVHDKRVLDEEDIANANLIVYGKSDEADLRRFGPRYFLTPGPLSDERVAVVEVERDAQVSIALYETSGIPVWRRTMTRRSTKVNVAR